MGAICTQFRLIYKKKNIFSNLKFSEFITFWPMCITVEPVGVVVAKMSYIPYQSKISLYFKSCLKHYYTHTHTRTHTTIEIYKVKKKIALDFDWILYILLNIHTYMRILCAHRHVYKCDCAFALCLIYVCRVSWLSLSMFM